MNAISRLVIRHRHGTVALFLVVAVIGALLATQVSVNYNMIDYLPEDAESTVALDVMAEEFQGAVPSVYVMVDDVSLQEADMLKDELAALEGVQMVTWLDDTVDLKTPIETVDAETMEAYYKDGSALYMVAVEDGKEIIATDAIYELVGEKGALTGDSVSTATMQKVAFEECMKAICILVPVVIVLLLLTTTSWLEPVLFLFAIGIAVLLNMGTNAFLGEISFITQAISPILQMAVSLDYAIFLLNAFEEHRQTETDPKRAMELAVKQAVPAVAASALTTLFGFLSLTFMRFEIGGDLGLNLIKGIIFSYISVMFFLPALTLCFHGLLDKTKHKQILPNPGRVAQYLLRFGVPLLIMLCLTVAPSFLAQSRTGFIYGTGDPAEGSRLAYDTQRVDEKFGTANAMVVLVPRGDVAREKLLCDDLAQLDHVTSIVSYAVTVGPTIPSDFLDPDLITQLYSEHYARIILTTNTGFEGEDAFSLVRQIRETVDEYYDESYTCGQSANLYDMMEAVQGDTALVNGVAIIAIALTLLFTFRSALLPLLLILVIESAIWVNLAVPYFQDMSISYIGYLVVNTVQLGATIDYAILLTETYLQKRKRLPRKAAVREALGESMMSILTSAAIISIAAFTLAFTSTNYLVADLGMLLCRGTVLSLVMVLFMLPKLLELFDGGIQRLTLRSGFVSEKEKEGIK